MSKLPIKRAVAIKAGSIRYNTGKPCKHGHYSDRNAKSGKCLECVNIALRNDPNKRCRKQPVKEYQREYHKKYAQTPEGKAKKDAAVKRYRERQQQKKRELEKQNGQPK